MEQEIRAAVEAVKSLSFALKALRAAGVIRSRRFTGDLGEWYIEQLYKVERASSQTQKAWDFRVPTTGERLQVKTQSLDPQNRWNYLESDASLFDRLIVVILTESLSLCELYDVPVSAFPSILRVGKEQKSFYYWNDLTPWRVDPRTLPGYASVAELIEG